MPVLARHAGRFAPVDPATSGTASSPGARSRAGYRVAARAAERGARRAGSGAGYRKDIEGLRGLSVLLVVAFHAGVAVLPGGFVGVDVFFVISGFLITGLLVDELEARGTISLTRFYARRMRRLLPLACVVLVATAVVFGSVLPQLDRPGLGGDVAAAAVWVANWRYALAATDYLGGVDSSAVLHYWSLSVEEQFYLVWPLLLLLAAALGSRRPARLRRRVTVVLALVTAGSFAASVLTTAAQGPWAYFGLHTRAWELAVGGLLALGRHRLAGLPRAGASLAGLLGIGLIGFAAWHLGRDTPFPGTAALWPVVGAALVLGAGVRTRDGTALLLESGPLTYLGRISYAWYLWHWPCLVLVRERFGTVDAGDDGSVPQVSGDLILAAVVVSLLLAVASHHALENPVRRSGPLLRSPRLSLGLGTVAVAASVAVAATGPGLPWPVPLLGTAGTAAAAASGTLPDADLPPDGAASTVPTPSELPSVQASGSAQTFGPPGTRVLRMTPEQARQDDAAPDRCFLGFAAVTVDSSCRFGRPGGPVVVLFGDSHAAHWYPAVARAAAAQGWTLYFWAKSACGYADVPQWISTYDRYYTECATWRASVLAKVALLPRVDLVLVGRTFAQFSKVTDAHGARLPVERAAETWGEGADRTLSALRLHASAVVLLEDTPRPVIDAPVCLSEHLRDPDACDYPREGHVDLDADLLAAEVEPVARAGASVLDLGDLVCSTDPCPVVSPSGAIMFRDEHHLTATFARELAPQVAQRLEPLVAAGQ